MPSSPQLNASAIYDEIRRYLVSLLPDAVVMRMPTGREHDPLLLLQTKRLVAAFAVSDTDLRSSYAAFYGRFKECYAQRSLEWDGNDIAFVLCIRSPTEGVEEFCSEIETDVFFCRKFAVLLSSPLNTCLARLPFLPLTPIRGGSLRPPSAQTLLQQSGVAPTLARYLVAQHARSAERIVEDCLGETFGDPRLGSTGVRSTGQQEDSPVPAIRLERVSISNFRAYRRPQSFDVGADLTVLYGPNGFGKTSFFDAVDFAMTGGIGRIESVREIDFTKAAQHLDTGSADSVVSLLFKQNNATRVVTRNVRDRKQAFLDEQPADRKRVLSEITGANSSATDRVENLVNLFRATHLFSQEQQELTKDFQDDCRLSAEIVSRMLAFEDYTNAIAKTRRVCEIVESTVEREIEAIERVSSELADDRSQLRRLNEAASTSGTPDTLAAELQALRTQLVDIGIESDPEETDAAAVRGWRVSLESRIGGSQSKLSRLSELSVEVARLPPLREEVARLEVQVIERQSAVREAEGKVATSQADLRSIEHALQSLGLEQRRLRAHVERLHWTLEVIPVSRQLADRERTLASDLGRATAATHHLQSDAKKRVDELEAEETRYESAVRELQARRDELLTLQNLAAAAPGWKANRGRLANVDDSTRSAHAELDALRNEDDELAPLMSAGHAEEARLSRQIADVDKNQSELRNLVSRLQSHVITGTCPLCGEEHGTRDELLRRIARHVSIDAASSARTNVATVRERLKQLAERATNIERRRQEANRKIAETQQERQGLVSEIASYERAVSAQGISWGSSEFDLAQQLSSRQDQVLRAVDSVRQQLESIDASRVAARQSRATAEALLAAKSADAGTIRGEFESVRERHAQLRRDSRFLQSLFDLAEDQLASDHKASIDRLLEVDRAIATATADVAARKASHREAAQQLSTLLSQLNETRAQLTDHQKASARIVAQLEDTKLPQDSSADVVLSLLSDESRRQATLTNLRDLVANMEIAIDSATTAAVLAELQQSIRNKEATIEQAALRRDANQPWLKYFEAVSRLLSLQRDRATDEFTQEYGPRASIIQRRIRSVYGFDDIEITSRESAIYVRVTRRGEQLRPIDYFSQSQQQTLLLGLFLSACSSQTWSAFSPVFLDDPVTHFDDLNTYALLDLIVGLLGSEFPARQFVISTCDEKLLQLARQKFRYLGTRARFYRFSAIGEDGPVVTEIQTQ